MVSYIGPESYPDQLCILKPTTAVDCPNAFVEKRRFVGERGAWEGLRVCKIDHLTGDGFVERGSRPPELNIAAIVRG